MNRSSNYLLLLALFFSFAFSSISQAALNKESKVIPLKESDYRKENIGPKKAVKKVQTEEKASAANSSSANSSSSQKAPTVKASSSINLSSSERQAKAKAFFDQISSKSDKTSAKTDSTNTAKTTDAASTRASVQSSDASTNADTSKTETADYKPIATRAATTASKPVIANSSKNNLTTGKVTSSSAIKVVQPKASTNQSTAVKASQSQNTANKATPNQSTTVKASQSQPAATKASQAKTTNSKPADVKASQTVKKQNLNVERTPRKERIKEPDIRVKLGSGTYSDVKVSFPNGGQVVNSKGKRVKSLKANEEFTWTSKIEVKEEKPQKGKKSKKAKKPEPPKYLNETLSFKPNKSLFKFNGNEYRGSIAIKFTSSGATVVNIVSLEDYLRGVVGSEIGASSPDESLKAQAIIARTYAYSHKGRHSSDNADICSTTHCQVYSGVKAERAAVDSAVKSTKAYILTHNGTPITALYFATCGGMTSNNSDVFGGAQLPYLTRVKCDFCTKGSKYRWNQEISVPQLRAALAKENVTLSEAYGVKIEAPSQMDRVSYMVFQTKNGEQKIKGTTVRRIFDLPSTTFVLGNKSEVTNIIASAKSVAEPVKPTKYKNYSNIMINGFANPEVSPKQLLVYSSSGLVRARIPSDGWKCISYNFKEATDSKVSASQASKSKSMTSIATPKQSKALKPISQINLFGRGYGHQVGMCQSGAIEMGKQGWNYKQILAHYYRGVALRSLGY